MIPADRAQLGQYIRDSTIGEVADLRGLETNETVPDLRTRNAHLFTPELIRQELKLARESNDPVEREAAKRRAWIRAGVMLQQRAAIDSRHRELFREIDRLKYQLSITDNAMSRRDLSEDLRRVTDDALPVLMDTWHVRWRSIAELEKQSDYESFYAFTKNIDSVMLVESARMLLSNTETSYFDSLSRYCEDAGIVVDDLCTTDVPRLINGQRWTECFPAAALESTLRSVSAKFFSPLDALPGLEMDLDHRPRKSSRAFAAAINAPHSLVLGINPVGGWRDFEAALHELGHIHHFALTDASLPWELRNVVDDAVGEAHAYLIARLIRTPSALMAFMNVPRREAMEFADYARFVELYMVRRYAARVIFEIDFHAAHADHKRQAIEQAAVAYREATGVSTTGGQLLAELDTGLYALQYFNAWLLCGSLTAYFKSQWGHSWWENHSAVEVLRRMWREASATDSERLLTEAGVISNNFNDMAVGLITDLDMRREAG